MTQPPRFDASNQPPSDAKSSSHSPRPFLGIRFECCRTYGRIYRNDAQTAYCGQCPKCGGRVNVPIGSGGSSARFFSAG
jgi:hypothetical protein